MKETIFRILCLAITVGSSVAAYYAFQHSTLIAIICIVVAVWFLLTLFGNMFARRYIEGCVVRYLMHLGGSATIEQLNERYATKAGTIDAELASLSARGVVSVNNDTVVLNTSALNKGFYNSIMLWSTRKLYNQSLKRDEQTADVSE